MHTIYPRYVYLSFIRVIVLKDFTKSYCVVYESSDFIWDFGKLPFLSHLGKYFIKIGKIRAKIHEIGKIKAIFGLGMTPIYGLKNGQIKSLESKKVCAEKQKITPGNASKFVWKCLKSFSAGGLRPPWPPYQRSALDPQRGLGGPLDPPAISAFFVKSHSHPCCCQLQAKVCARSTG